MLIDCISDLHGNYPQLEGADLLIVAGDLFGDDSYDEVDYFQRWIAVQKYKKKIVIAGNHDNQVSRNPNWLKSSDIDYLCDSGTEFEYEEEDPIDPGPVSLDVLVTTKKKVKIWGSPWTKRFKGMNPNCMAFTVDTDEELAEKWALIPNDIDILVTHCPPNGILDGLYPDTFCGSVSLRNKVLCKIKPKLHIFGHIHEWGGKQIDLTSTIFVNASHLNALGDPVNAPVRIEL